MSTSSAMRRSTTPPCLRGLGQSECVSNRIVHPIALQSSLSFSQLLGKRLKEACGREFGPTYLRKCLNLARSFPDIAGLRAELDWKQYEEIYRIKDLKRRQEITNAAAEGAWEPSRIRLHREYQGLDTLPSYSRCCILKQVRQFYVLSRLMLMHAE